MNKPKLIIYGNGSMAKTYATFLEQKYDIEAFTVTENLIAETNYYNKPLVSFEKIADFYTPTNYHFIVAVGYVGMNEIREDVALKAKALGFKDTFYVDKSFFHHSSINIGANTVIFNNTAIHNDTDIGNNVFISSGVNIGHNCKIGNNVWINSGVSLAGGVHIGSNTFIGMNATISHNLNIGEKNFIGAATLVNSNTDDNVVIIAPAGEQIPMNSETFLRFSRVMNNG